MQINFSNQNVFIIYLKELCIKAKRKIVVFLCMENWSLLFKLRLKNLKKT